MLYFCVSMHLNTTPQFEQEAGPAAKRGSSAAHHDRFSTSAKSSLFRDTVCRRILPKKLNHLISCMSPAATELSSSQRAATYFLRTIFGVKMAELLSPLSAQPSSRQFAKAIRTSRWAPCDVVNFSSFSLYFLASFLIYVMIALLPCRLLWYVATKLSVTRFPVLKAARLDMPLKSKGKQKKWRTLRTNILPI